MTTMQQQKLRAELKDLKREIQENKAIALRSQILVVFAYCRFNKDEVVRWKYNELVCIKNVKSCGRDIEEIKKILAGAKSQR